jgi:hypothetical protein
MKFRTLLRPNRLVPLAFLLYWLAFAYQHLVRTLFRTWFFNSDEYALAAEIIRFSQHDFRQHFFDNPGTLFMLIDTAGWTAFYGIRCALGLSARTGIGVFTFGHLPALFVLMRATTLLFYLLSVVLLFVLTARLLNPAAAAVASLLLVMSPAYSSYSSFARTESLAMVLMLGAILCLMRGLERAPEASSGLPRLRDPVIIAGILAGLAAGARLHSVTGSLPPLVLLLWLQKPFPKDEYPDWILRCSKLVLPAGWAAAGVLLVLAELRLRAAPGARHFVMAAAAGWIAVSGTALFLYRFARTRPLLVRALSPDLIKLGLGCCVGGVLGNPTVLWRYNYFLSSVQMYSDFVDEERLGWPFWRNAAWYFRYYISVVAADNLILILLCAGAIAILIARDRKVIPFLAGAALFFVSKPIWLRASYHHIILWLPYFCIVCAYPAGKAFDWISTRFRHAEWPASAALAVGLILCFHSVTPGPEKAVADMLSNEARLPHGSTIIPSGRPSSRSVISATTRIRSMAGWLTCGCPCRPAPWTGGIT